MNKFGFVRVASAIPSVKVGNCAYNTAKIIEQINEAEEKNANIIVFPELCITGYTCGDLFFNQALRSEAKNSLDKVTAATKDKNIIAIVGLPYEHKSKLFNVAAVVQSGRIISIVPKTYLPNYNEFYEMRWFTSSKDIDNNGGIDTAHGKIQFLSPNIIFHTQDFSFGVEICEDMWAPIPPSCNLALAGADIIFNLSADNGTVGKQEYVNQLISQQSARCLCAYVFSSCGFGESTTDVVFPGNAYIYENGIKLAEAKSYSMTPQIIYADIDVDYLRSERLVNKTFAESSRNTPCTYTASIFQRNKQKDKLLRNVNAMPFVPTATNMQERCNEIFDIQTMGLAKRITHTRCQTAVIGISGGLDSTLALLVCVNTFDKLNIDRKNIIGVTMTGVGTTDRTYQNALDMMKSLGITIREISIKDACIQHFKDIEHPDGVYDVTYENAQARERTQILMDIANQKNGMVIGTGDLSEIALGWATYNGDHMSMYAVNASVPKTLIRYLVNWYATTSADKKLGKTLKNVLETPVSPELLPKDEKGDIAQKTEDLVGPYELHDFFLYNMVRCHFRPAKIFFLAQNAFGGKYADDVIKHWLKTFVRRFFNQQFKRSCMPDGPKVGSVSLSPRGDWRMPSDADSELWLTEAENL